MPRPLVKRKPPKPGPITIRRMGTDTPEATVSAPEMARRAEEVKWIREATAVSLEVYAEQERLAPYLKLKPDYTVSIPKLTQQVCWFVLDVNAIEYRITADTLLFGAPLERTFPFSMVERKPLSTRGEQREAAVALNTLKQHRARR